MKVYKIDNAFYMEDNDNIVELEPNKDYYVKLPQNSCNRVWVSCKKVDNAPNQTIDYGDIVKIPRVLGPYNHGKKLEDYMTAEEKAIVDEIMAKCAERKAADKPKPLTDLEKAERELKRAMKKLEALKATAK